VIIAEERWKEKIKQLSELAESGAGGRKFCHRMLTH
jgi:hypothetical protein